jgi:MoaA/NifB/PqqE/SkfB family radical SAM enzyme
MQAIYWVLTWACHRKCAHCYDDRFRPYVRDALRKVVAEGQHAYQKIIINLPDDMTWANPQTGHRERTLIVMAGGELLIDGVREELFYPALDAIKARWGDKSPRISIQTTGDVVTPEILDEVLARGVTTIAIASIDDYHVGMKGERKFKFMEHVRQLMNSRGVREVSLGGAKSEKLKSPDPAARPSGDGPSFLFFGAQEDLWIGELWPRGRAWSNGLSNAGYETNFCARWSGGKNFLKMHQAGSEIAIEPDGSIYPCCLKTKAPLGSLAEERLEDILKSVATLPAIQALNDGDPERMGKTSGWSRDDFRAKSVAVDGKGREMFNMCLGCDRYFEEHLGAELRAMRESRLAETRKKTTAPTL